MASKFMVTIRCTACQHKYKRVLQAENEDALAYVPDPPCPMCSAQAKRKKFDFASGKAPSAGGSLVARAVDTAAEITMQDYGMTDMRSDAREGETVAPKLPPKLQQQADNMFAGAGGKRRGPGIFGMSNAQIMKQAVGGRFNTADTVNPIAAQDKAKQRVPVHIIAGDNVRGRV